MSLALSTTLHTSFADAVERTRKALADQGFGVLTEIDMKTTLKAKLGEDMEDYLILGACNPPLAHRAVNVDRQIGLLLPRNVVVRADPDAIERALDLDREALATSRSVFAGNGNASSAGIFFVLEEMQRCGTRGRVLAIALGPGLSIELALMHAA